MYRDYVFSCIDRALEETKKSSPKAMIGFLIFGVLLCLNGISLIAFQAGIRLLFMDPAGCGFLSLAAGILCLAFAGMFATDLFKSRSANAPLKEREKYMQMVRALGNENAVFGLLDSLPPIKIGDSELRLNQNIIACSSAENLNNNFVYPLFILTNMGTGAIGSTQFFYMHFMIGGKKEKKSINCTPYEAESIMRQLKTYKPNIQIGT